LDQEAIQELLEAWSLIPQLERATSYVARRVLKAEAAFQDRMPALAERVLAAAGTICRVCGSTERLKRARALSLSLCRNCYESFRTWQIRNETRPVGDWVGWRKTNLRKEAS